MASNPVSISTLIADRIASLSKLVFVVFFAVFLAACSDSASISQSPTPTVSPQADTNPITIDTDSHNRHTTGSVDFTNSNDDIWPPQPTGITNVEIIEQVTTTTSDRVKKNLSVENSRKAILADSTLNELLGKNYVWLGEHLVESKSGDNSHTELEIFAYDSNSLITVAVKAGDIINFTQSDASSYQPAESQSEVEAAIFLASVALSEQGFTEHQQLTGTALLAHPSASEIAESGQMFYAERILYVTFGPGNGVLPHYRATVNLSRSVVEQSGAIE